MYYFYRVLKSYLKLLILMRYCIKYGNYYRQCHEELKIIVCNNKDGKQAYVGAGTLKDH